MAAAVALGLLTNAPTLIKLAVNAIHDIEELFGKGKGVDKKAAVIAAVSDVANIATTAGVPGVAAANSDLMAAIGDFVDAYVHIMNIIGQFKK